MKARIVKPYWNPYVGGVALGVVLFLSFLVTSHGLGASGGFARVALWFEDLVAPAHVDRTALLAEWAGGDTNPLDHWLVFGILGVLLGGFVSGFLGGRNRIETIRGPRVSKGTRLAFAFAGGLVMGYAARLARGCTSGQALSGGAVLSLGSWVFMFSVFAGGYALSIPVRRLWR